MAIHHQDPLESMGGQGQHQVMQHGQQCRGLQAHRSGKAEMVLGHAKGLNGGHQNAAPAAQFQCDGFGREGIGADGAGRAMLFGGSERDDHALARFQVAIHVRPALQSEADGIRAGDRAW